MSRENGKRQNSYERYFEGYTRRPVLDAAGNVKMTLVYTAPYWILDSEENDWIKRKCVVALLALAQLGCFLAAALLRTESNRSALVVLPSGLSAACLLFTLTAAVRYAAAKREMTIYDYRTTRDSLRRWNFDSGVLLLLAAVGTLASLSHGSNGRTLAAALGYGLAGSIGLLQCRLEDRCFYRETENENAYC